MELQELDILGSRIQFLTEPNPTGEDFCLFRGTVPPKTAIPLHSHVDREVFLIQEGEVDVYVSDRWAAHKAGDVVNVPSNVKHALVNKGEAPVVIVTITTDRLCRFFGEVGRPVAEVEPGPPPPELLAKFAQVSDSYGYWLAGPDENAAIGVPMRGPPAGAA